MKWLRAIVPSLVVVAVVACVGLDVDGWMEWIEYERIRTRFGSIQEFADRYSGRPASEAGEPHALEFLNYVASRFPELVGEPSGSLTLDYWKRRFHLRNKGCDEHYRARFASGHVLEIWVDDGQWVHQWRSQSSG